MCTDIAEDPRMCPKCSKIFCLVCLCKNAEKKEECYYCKSKLKIEQFLDCTCFINFAESLIIKLNSKNESQKKL